MKNVGTGKRLMVGLLSGAVLGLLFVSPPAASADGAEVWTKKCKKCHGDDGKGETPTGKKLKAKDMTTADFQKSVKDDDIVTTVMKGKGDGEGHKKPVSGVSDAEAKELVKVVRGFKK